MPLSLKLLILPIIIMLTLIACNKYPEANMPNEPLEQPLDIIKEPKIVAMTLTFSVGLKDDGTIWVWGRNIGLSSLELNTYRLPQKINEISNISSVHASEDHVLLLKNDGTVWGWGSNFRGKLNPSSNKMYIDRIIQINNLKNVIHIYADWDRSYFTLKNGEVLMLGNNENGMAEGDKTSQLKNLSKVKGIENIVMMKNSLALDEYGDIYQYIYRENNESKMERIDFPRKVVDFTSDSTKLVLLDDGTVWSWGDGTDAGQGNRQIIENPTRIQNISKVIKIDSNIAYTSEKSIYIWGDFSYKCETCLLNNLEVKEYKTPVLFKSNVSVKQLISEDNISTLGYVDSNGDVFFWGSNEDWQFGSILNQEVSDKNHIFKIHKSNFQIYK